MNKAQIVEAIANDAGITKTQAGKAFDSVIANIISAMQKGDDVAIVGFGTFKATERAARKGRNPKTGEPLEIAARKAPSFSAGKALKDAINGN